MQRTNMITLSALASAGVASLLVTAAFAQDPPEAQTEPADEPADEPVTEPATEPAAEPTEPMAEPMAEPTGQQAGKATGKTARIGVESDAPYGEYLVDAQGKTLYMFTTDSPSNSTCYGACARAWPPLTTTGTPQTAAPGLEADKLGTLKRKDGSMQVTYAGWPLYYFARDTASNEVAGQDIRSFGGEWYLLSPDGTINRTTKQGKQSKQPETKSESPSSYE